MDKLRLALGILILNGKGATNIARRGTDHDSSLARWHDEMLLGDVKDGKVVGAELVLDLLAFACLEEVTVELAKDLGRLAGVGREAEIDLRHLPSIGVTDVLELKADLIDRLKDGLGVDTLCRSCLLFVADPLA